MLNSARAQFYWLILVLLICGPITIAGLFGNPIALTLNVLVTFPLYGFTLGLSLHQARQYRRRLYATS